MALLCCTKKLLDKLPFKVEVAATERVAAGVDDWYANLFRLDRKGAIIFTHAASLYTFIVEKVRKEHFAKILPMFRFGLEQRLQCDGFTDEQNNMLLERFGDIRIARTRSRSVLGSMNDMVNCGKFMYDHRKCEYEDVLDEVIRRLNKMPMKAIGYQFPVEKFIESYGLIKNQ